MDRLLKLNKQLAAFKLKPNLGIVSSWWYEEYYGGLRIRKTPSLPNTRYKLVNRVLMGGDLISGSSPLISKLAWNSVGGMDIHHPKGIDSDLYRRIVLSNYNIYIIKEIMVVADVDHLFGRMTPLVCLSSVKKDLISNLRTLCKFNFLYLLFPLALLYRMKIILRLLLLAMAIFVRTKNS